ncbi:hypothetical protein K440DRAFT_663450 [Wilcoxina mikolae CBS 423.85]|nr:hypothetical protein K440DRAFT_663450 [Wilcoxina mikolae CBS 423.85]
MPDYNGVSARILTSSPLAEYPAPSDFTLPFPVLSVYVEAQPGSNFSITCDALPGSVPNSIAFKSKIDGKNYHEGSVFRARQKDAGVWVENNTAFQKYRFQDVKMVEERGVGMISREQAAEIGVIEVAVVRCTMKKVVEEVKAKKVRKEKRDELKLKKSSKSGSPKKELAMFETLHEKDAKGRDVSAMVSFGQPEYMPRRSKASDDAATTRTIIKMVDWQDGWNEPYVLFRFLYLKRDRLQALGLIPTDPDAVQIRVEPEEPVVNEPKSEQKPKLKQEGKDKAPTTRGVIVKAKRERRDELNFMEIEAVDLTDI